MFDPNEAATNRRLLVLHAGFRELLQTVKAAQPMISGMLESIENNVEQSLTTISGDYAQWMVEGQGPGAYASWLQYPNLELKRPKDIPMKVFDDVPFGPSNPAIGLITGLNTYFQNMFDFLNFKLPMDLSTLPMYDPDISNPRDLRTGIYQVSGGGYGEEPRKCVVLKTEGVNQCILILSLSDRHYYQKDPTADFVYVPIEDTWVKHSAIPFVTKEDVETQVKKIKEDYQLPIVAKGDDLSSDQLAIFLSFEIGALRQKYGENFEKKFEVNDHLDILLSSPPKNGVTLFRDQERHILVWKYRMYAVVCKLQTPESDTRHLELREYKTWQGGRYDKENFNALSAYTRAGLSKRILDDFRKAYPLNSEETEQEDTEQAES